jgi:S1-C subfamily serine protease
VSGEIEHEITLDTIKRTLGATHIYSGPDSSKQTRSAWGPDLYRATVNAAVLVEVYDFKEGAEPKFLGYGSGVLVSENGEILTNWHVTWPHQFVVVIFYPGPSRTYNELKEDDVWFARVKKVEKERDLALLQLVMDKPMHRILPARVKPVPLEDPNQLEVGQDVFAIGHPEGLHWTYTEGVISQIRPRYQWQTKGANHKATVVQTQTLVSFGSSGGPLIDRNGRLVGIIESSLPDRAGFNLAISVHELRSFLGR